MKPTLLFIVEDAFQIKGRGCVLVPGLLAEPGAPAVRIGAAIRLLTPNGTSIDTVIRGIEMLNRGLPPPVMTAPILLPKNITKEQVPRGTQVVLLMDDEKGDPAVASCKQSHE